VAGLAPEIEFLLPSADGLEVVAVLGEVAPESVLCGCIAADEPSADGSEGVPEPGLFIELGEPAWPLADIPLLVEPAPAPVVPVTLPVCAKATAENVIKATPGKPAIASRFRLVKRFILCS
jgi:hypothetical protein